MHSSTSRNIPILLWLSILLCLLIPIIIDYSLFPEAPLAIYLLFLLPIIIFPFYYDKKGILIGTIIVNAIHILWSTFFLPLFFEIYLLNRIVNHLGLTIISFVTVFFLYKLIKQMKLKELHVQENKDLYQNVVEISPNPILILQSDIIVYANVAAVQLAGFPSYKELLNRSIADLMLPTSKEIYQSKMKKINAGEIPDKPIEYQLVRPDGKPIYIETLCKQIIYQGEAAILAVGNDVTDRKEKEAELRRSEALLDKAQRIAHLGSWEGDLTSEKLYWSTETYRIFGCAPNEFEPTYESFLDFVPPEDRDIIIEANEQAFTRDGHYSIEHRIIRTDGVARYVFLQAEITFNDHGEPVYIVGTIQDITEKRQMEKELTESEERFRSLVQYSHEMIGIVDENGIILYLSPSFERILGYDTEEMIGINAFEIIHPEDAAFAMEKLTEVVHTPETPIKSELRIKHDNGDFLYCELVSTNMIHQPSVNGIAINFRDITAQKKSFETIQQMAFHDDITQLINKPRLSQLVTNEMNSDQGNSPFSLLFLDLDNFKYVNDSLGHHIGDMLLKEVAILLKEQVGEHGTVARIGGDEFVIFLKDSNEEMSPMDMANKVIRLFKKPFQINTYQLYMSTSIGIAVYPDAGEDFNTLLKNADMAMYNAKNSGKNTFRMYDHTIKKMNERFFRLQNDLRTALTNEEFVLHYQPRIRSGDQKIIGVEALIRWNHPTLGMIPPSEFITIAEDSGLIVELGEWIIETACKQLVAWEQSGYESLTMSINFSTIQFLQVNLHENVKSIIEKYQVNPKRLEIEVTESAIIDQDLGIQDNICKLKKLGLQIAIDDFGTGYSSLMYIKRFSADTIKIDRSFVMSLDEDTSDIVLAIVNLAKALGLNVVAEGVETCSQFNKLKEMDCNEVQGYYFSKPLPCDDIEQRFLRSGV